MKKITNPFQKGDKVICISDNFPIIPEYSGGATKGTDVFPKVGEILFIDETLGDFVRFDKYDSESFNWWYWNRFAKVDEVMTKIKSMYPLVESEEDLLEFVDEI